MSDELILDKIEAMLPYFTKSELKVAEYILNSNNTINCSLSTLAKKIKVSEPTIIRFSRSIGLNGYSDLKLKLSINNSINDSKELKNLDIKLNKGDDAYEIYRSLSEYTIKSIRSTWHNTLDKKTKEKAIDLIYNTHKNNKKIFLTGMGVSSILAESLQIKLMRLDIDSIFYSDIHLRLEACSNLKKDDLLICFTTLGKSKENHDFINLAKDKGVKVILITQFGVNKINKSSDIVIYTSAIENNLRLATQASFIVQNLIIETIFLSLALKDYDKISESVKDTKDIFHKYGYNLN